MRKSVIILTCGQSGSSVLTALVARGGYWCGDETTDVGYNTYENADLVALDREIVEAGGVDWTRLPPRPIDDATIEGLHKAVQTLDASPAKALVEKCEAHRPWIWKDPRLSYTIRYWESLIDVRDCQFIVMGRDFRQAWAAHMIKGKHPVSYDRFVAVQGGILESGRQYVEALNLPYLWTTFEELTLTPEKVIGRLNDFLGTELTLDDFRAVYNGPVGKLRWSKVDYVHAWARFQAHRLILRDLSGPASGRKQK